MTRLRLLAVVGLVLTSLAGGVVWYYQTRPEKRLQRGRSAIERGDWDTATRISDRLEAAGQLDRANLLRGESLAARERWDEALPILNRIRDEGPLRLQAAVVVGKCLLGRKELREAYRVYSFVLTQDSDNVEAHRGLAAIAYDLGNLTAALHHLEEVARLDDTDGRSYRLKGLVLTYLGHDAEAEEAYRAALERKLSASFRQQVQMELAERLAKQTRYREVLDLLEERRQENEDDLPALALRGEALFGLGRTADVEKLLEGALEDYPKNSTLWSLRGQTALTRNRPDEAVKALERAVELAPGDYRFRFQLANAYRAAQRADDALKQEQRAKELNMILEQLSTISREAMKKPFDAKIRWKLADMCDKINEPKLADMWRKAAQACEKDPNP
jgi:tetratricopeptide (TPR) repeat protein